MTDTFTNGTVDTFAPLGRAMTRTDLVIEAIRTAILSGKLKPGMALVERTIAEELNVSKTPVREALIALVRNGLVEMTRNRGATVRQMTLNDVLQVYQTRLLLEPWAVGEAARKAQQNGGFQAAEALLNQADELSVSSDKAGRVQANRKFHRLMYVSCDNALIIDTLDSLQDLAALGATAFLWEIWPTWDAESQEHRKILEAVKNGEGDRAQELVANHISSSITRIINLQQEQK
ncbi:MAG: GntR family transcriptional regulator [Microbacteriaceae bacterium]